MMTPVFYLRYFFYIPADSKFSVCALIIFGSHHYPKNWKANTILDITQSIYLYHNIIMTFDITKSILDNTKSIFWYHKFEFVI